MLNSREQIVDSRFGMFYSRKTFILNSKALHSNTIQISYLLFPISYLNTKEHS